MTSALQQEDVAALGLKAGRLVALNHSFDSIASQCFTVDHVLGGRLAACALLDHKLRRGAQDAFFRTDTGKLPRDSANTNTTD